MKRIIAMLLAVMMVFALCACSNGDKDKDSDVKDDGKVDLTFATGGEQGTYYAFGTVLAQQVSDKTSTNVTAVVSKGSQANVEDLQANGAQLGFVQSDVMSYAYNGEKLFEGNKITDFSVVAALYMEQVQIVTLDSGIKTVADLKGKTVSIGAKGSGVYFNALDILGAYGLTENDIERKREDGVKADAHAHVSPVGVEEKRQHENKHGHADAEIGPPVLKIEEETHSLSAVRSPRRPVGRIIRMRMSTRKATTSFQATAM